MHAHLFKQICADHRLVPGRHAGHDVAGQRVLARPDLPAEVLRAWPELDDFEPLARAGGLLPASTRKLVYEVTLSEDQTP